MYNPHDKGLGNELVRFRAPYRVGHQSSIFNEEDFT